MRAGHLSGRSECDTSADLIRLSSGEAGPRRCRLRQRDFVVTAVTIESASLFPAPFTAPDAVSLTRQRVLRAPLRRQPAWRARRGKRAIVGAGATATDGADPGERGWTHDHPASSLALSHSCRR